MKIPKIRKLPSGAWSCQLRIDGQSISITDDDRKTVEAKAYAYKAGIIKLKRTPTAVTVGKVMENYIRSREDVVSPSTARGYNTILRTRFKALQSVTINTLTDAKMQAYINDESRLCSPKTLKNSYMLVSSAIVFAGGERFNVRLPQVPPAQKAYFTPEQITVFCELIKGTSVEVPALLGLWSCRRSEIFGLRWEAVDLKNRVIHIRNSLVIGEGGQLVEKQMTKNTSSTRTIPICQQLYDALERLPDKSGLVVQGHPNSLYESVNNICRKNKLPLVGAHGLWHSFASLAYKLNIPEKIAMQIGGWKTNDVMHRIYVHLSQDDINSYAAEMLSFFDRAPNANGNANESQKTG